MNAFALANALAANVPAPTSPLAQAQAAAAERLASLRVPSIDARYPDPEEFRALNDYLHEIASAIDPLIEAIGAHANENASGGIVLTEFKSVLRDAFDGRASYELTNAADTLQDEIDSDA